MRLLLIILIFFFNKLYALYFLYPTTTNDFTQVCKAKGKFNTNSSPRDVFVNNASYFNPKCAAGQSFLLLSYNSNVYLINSSEDCNNTKNYNIQCLQNNLSGKAGGMESLWKEDTYCNSNYSGNSYRAVISDQNLAFCKIKPNYIYDAKKNVWMPLETEGGKGPLCSSGKFWNDTNQSCQSFPPCNLTCKGIGEVLNHRLCVCKCQAPLIRSSGSCVPNPDINESECTKEGGKFLQNISPTQFFSDPKYAYLVMQVPLFSSHLCYTEDYINKSLAKIKSAISPKNVILGALSILPIGKLKNVFRAEDLVNTIEKTAKNPKVLQDNTPIIDTKYNPDTGTYEPVVNLKPRTKPLPAPDLLQAPKDPASADTIVATGDNLKDFLNSPFASKDLSTPKDLTDAAIDYSIDHNLRAGTQTKIADDLREIFNRSKPQEESNFPMVIKDDVGDGQLIDAQVKREITPVPQTVSNTKNTTNNYNVTYYITPQGASKPTVITYKVRQEPAAAPGAAPKIIATPTYRLGETKYIGKEMVVKKNSEPATAKSSTPKSDTAAKDKPQVKVNYNSFVSPAEQAITNGFNYKINLFTCPNVTPKCPNSIDINYSVMKVNGQFKIPDPMCAVITAIDNPKISPVITTAANLIVLLAGIMGALTLFRRD